MIVIKEKIFLFTFIIWFIGLLMGIACIRGSALGMSIGTITAIGFSWRLYNAVSEFEEGEYTYYKNKNKGDEEDAEI